MPTFGELKSRIADEFVNESVTTAQIENAIKDAIQYYERRRFYFNETLVNTAFTTVAGSENYAESDATTAAPETIVVTVTDSAGLKQRLTAWSYEQIEDMQDGSVTGLPEAFAIYRQQIRLYPIPDAAYAVNVSYVKRFTALSGEDDTNVWTTDAAGLIRQAAKRRIALDVLHAEDMAARCAVLEKEEYDELLAETRRRRPNTTLRPAMMLNTSSFNMTTGD
jgi:hypothetical protein